MSCVSPLTLPNGFTVPCGMCMQCRIRRQSSLSFLAERELVHDVYSKGLGASFVTLTYSEDSVPFCSTTTMMRASDVISSSHVPDNFYTSLYKPDLQKFFKRVRRSMDYHNINVPFRYLASGEFGESTARPHYHIIFLGLSDVLSETVTKKNWPYGFIDVGPLGAGGIRYCTKYITKKYDSYPMYIHEKSLGVTGPFLIHSIHIGYNWINSHLNQIVDSDFTFISKGRRLLYPKNVRDFVSRKTGVDPMPSIVRYLASDRAACPQDKDYQDFVRERNILREEYLRSAALSRGMTVTPELLARRSWIYPRSHRVYSDKLALESGYDDDVPF